MNITETTEKLPSLSLQAFLQHLNKTTEKADQPSSLTYSTSTAGDEGARPVSSIYEVRQIAMDATELDKQWYEFADLLIEQEERQTDLDHLPQSTFISSRMLGMSFLASCGAVIWGRPNLLCIYVPSCVLSMMLMSLLWPLTALDWWVWRNRLVLGCFVISMLNTMWVFAPFVDDTINWWNNVADYHYTVSRNFVTDTYYGIDDSMTEAEIAQIYLKKSSMEWWLDTILWFYAFITTFVSIQLTCMLYQTRAKDTFFFN
jgi:hypothetical protein